MKTPIIHCLNIGPYQVNTYIVACPETLQGVIIDPGGEPDRIADLVEQHHIQPLYILNTHGHRDHVPANADMAGHFNIKIGMHQADINFFTKQFRLYNDEAMLRNFQAALALSHEDDIRVGSMDIQVIHTPGHTPGSVCYLVGRCLFSGDTLFVGSAGRTDLPGGDLHTLIQSIHERLVVLPDETILYPGHDYGSTPVSTMGREKKENLYITDFI